MMVEYIPLAAPTPHKVCASVEIKRVMKIKREALGTRFDSPQGVQGIVVEVEHLRNVDRLVQQLDADDVGDINEGLCEKFKDSDCLLYVARRGKEVGLTI